MIREYRTGSIPVTGTKGLYIPMYPPPSLRLFGIFNFKRKYFLYAVLAKLAIASAFQAEDHGFESRIPLHYIKARTAIYHLKFNQFEPGNNDCALFYFLFPRVGSAG